MEEEQFGLNNQDRPQITNTTKFFTGVWQLKLPTKIQIHLWRVANNFLPLLANLVTRCFQIVATCLVCNLGDETAANLFWECRTTRQVLEAIGVDPTMANMQQG